jgi:photosystem II stability/assembly factor-like uncharacterized protein
MERRHRAAPGYDWHAIEAENLRESLARVALTEKAGGKSPWHERGPANQTGATAHIALRPDGKTFLLATAWGGIYSGSPDTGVWQRMTDGLGGWVHGLVVAGPPETWITSVDTLADSRVYVSRNRGASWTVPKGLPPLIFVYEMLRDGGNPKTVYVLAQVVQGDNAPPILARSRDGGLSFSVVWTGPDVERPGIWTSRTGAGPLYLVSHGQLYVSSNQGSSFTPLGQIAPAVNNHAILRGSEAGGPTLYAAIGLHTPLSTLYASEDAGQTWSRRSDFKDPTYPNDLRFGRGSLEVSSQDPNLVLFGSVNGYRSSDGGRTFRQINDWTEYYPDPSGKLHADIDSIHFIPWHGGERLFLGTDGGLYESADGGLSVRNVTESSLRNSQLYSTWSSASRPDLFLTGTQDQGLQLSGPGGPPGAVLGNAQLISGDYSSLTAASHDLSNVFALYPTIPPNTGNLLLIQGDDSGNAPRILQAPLPKFSVELGFFAASIADPDDPSTLYVAGDYLWKMTHQSGASFSQAKLSQQNFSDGTDYVAAIAIAPSDHGYWYLATVDGHLWYSRDRGASWAESDTTQASPPQYSAGALAVAAGDPLTCYMGGSGYGTPAIQVTHDGGATWAPLSKGLPSTTVWALAFDGLATQTLYAATEAGPYAYDSRAKIWRSLLAAKVPPGRYFSVEAVPAARLMRFGTYSRGVWDYTASSR